MLVVSPRKRCRLNLASTLGQDVLSGEFTVIKCLSIQLYSFAYIFLCGMSICVNIRCYFLIIFTHVSSKFGKFSRHRFQKTIRHKVLIFLEYFDLPHVSTLIWNYSFFNNDLVK